MAEEKDHIAQIRARRGRDSVQLTPQARNEVGYVAGGSAQEILDSTSLLGVDFKSPWLRDRVTLSLEAQISMIEQRANYRANTVDLGYTNRLTILPVRPGMYVKVEPTGCYRLTYHNR